MPASATESRPGLKAGAAFSCLPTPAATFCLTQRKKSEAALVNYRKATTSNNDKQDSLSRKGSNGGSFNPHHDERKPP
jgi:hypothetical protein